jgi:hypothetical protein
VPPALRRHRRRILALALLGAALGIAGCTPASRALLDVTPGLDALHAGARPAAPLNPRYRYLRLTVNGRPVMMILGFVEGPAADPTEVWYSSASEVLRLRDAMVVGSAALPVNWLDVRYSAWPRWADDSVQTFTRRVDVQPGYRFGLQQRLDLRPVPSPGGRELVGVDPRTLHWYALRDAATRHTDYYAVRRRAGRPPDVIYGEQCLAAKLCLTWQHWPVTR